MQTKINKLLLATIVAIAVISCDNTPQLGKNTVDEVVKVMTLDEKATLVIGTGMAGVTGGTAVVGESNSIIPGAAGTTFAIKRLNIPAIVLADGPAGVRIAPKREGDDRTFHATAFPTGTLLASTWNTELVQSVGDARGNEALEYGIDVLLTPALNIQRDPLCGRNFEYYSEDPVLSGKMSAAMINGIQKNNVGTSIKHFAANNQETNRTSSDSRLTQRALREIYLKGFEIGIKESNPWTVMSSYNYINGVYAPESRDLLKTILRDEWKYNGIVMTDWFGGESAPNMIYAGNDLLMPGLPQQKEAIINAVKEGELKESDLDLAVRNILELIVKTPRFKGYQYSETPDLNAHAAVTRQSAAEGMVLLKNDNNALPLSENIKNIAAYGVTSYDFISGGSGSGDVNSAYTVSLIEGLENSGFILNKDLRSEYENYWEEVRKIEAAKPISTDILASHTAKPRPEEIVPDAQSLNNHANTSDIALITIGRVSGEFIDRKIPGDFDLTQKEKELITTVTKAYHAKGKKVVVALNIGGVIETASWKTQPDAILLAWQAGQEGGNSVADVLKGAVNPSGKLTVTFPLNYMDAPSSNNFPYDYVMTGSLTEAMLSRNTGIEPVRNIDFTIYEEDIYVGYRYYDSFKKDVSYPFGYGLSYTSFEYLNPTITEKEGNITINVEVKNVGKVAGKEVVQVYVSAPVNNSYMKPSKELKAFAKTKELKSEESQILILTIDNNELASFDTANSRWVVDAGTYKIQIGASSRDIQATMDVNLVNRSEYKVNNILKEQFQIDVIKP